MIEAVKLADDRSGDVIVRLYEACGSHRTAVLTPGFEWLDAVRTDLLERELSDTTPLRQGDGIHLTLRAFELVTLRVRRP